MFFHENLSGYLWLIKKKIVVIEIIETLSQLMTISLAK